MPDGNAEQIHQIATALFEEWSKEEEKKRQRHRVLHGSLPAWIACGLSVTAVLWQAAVTSEKVENNTRRVEAIEAAKMGESLARLETKIDLLIDERGGN